MIVAIEMKEDLCSFPTKKKINEITHFLKNASISKVDKKCLVRWYFCTHAKIGMLKLKCSKDFDFISMGRYCHGFNV